MPRYKSKWGVTYSIDGTDNNSVLSVVHVETRLVRKREVTTERLQTYLRADKDSCLKYLHEIDKF